MERKDQQTQHHMTRRAAAHDYSRPGIYHITMHVTEEAGHQSHERQLVANLSRIVKDTIYDT